MVVKSPRIEFFTVTGTKIAIASYGLYFLMKTVPVLFGSGPSEETWNRLAEQVPELVVFLLLVMAFLAAIKMMTGILAKSNETAAKIMADSVRENNKIVDDVKDEVHANTVELTKVLSELRHDRQDEDR